MSLFDKKLSLMPVVIAPDVWQSAVEFPADPQQVEERLGNLLLAVLLTLRTAAGRAYWTEAYLLPERTLQKRMSRLRVRLYK